MNYKEILDLITRKDRKGLEALYTSYGQKLYAFAVDKWMLSEDEAWEVVYQTLDTLILKLSEYEFESKAHFDNFIFKVFTNYLKNYFRDHRKHQYDIVYVDMNEVNLSEQEEDELEEKSSLLELDSNSFNDYYQSETIDNPKLISLRIALENLDQLDRDILLLRAQNYSYDEIAQLLKIENNQLKVRHHRAKDKLIKSLTISS